MGVRNSSTDVLLPAWGSASEAGCRSTVVGALSMSGGGVVAGLAVQRVEIESSTNAACTGVLTHSSLLSAAHKEH